MDTQQILIDEWKEVRETIRYFGNKRFAQLTVFIAASGFLANAFFSQIDSDRRLALAIVGAVLSVLFAVMEYSSWKYWNAYAGRGVAIEGQLPPLELMSQHRPAEKVLSATCATFVVYFSVLALWVVACCTDTKPPIGVPAIVKSALDSAPTLAGNPA